MDDIAMMSGLTQEERAERARDAWELYQRQYGGDEISDLIADLAHLAEVEDDAPGGGLMALTTAETHFNAESPDAT